MGDLAFDPEGNIYGSVNKGGDYGFGMVYKLTPSGGGWTMTVLYSFLGGSDGAYPRPVIIDKAGNLFGTTTGEYNGPDWGTVFQLSPSDGAWIKETLHRFKGPGTYEGHGPTSLVMDSAGNLYGATAYGENFGPSVFQLTHSDQGWTFNLIWRLIHLQIHGPWDRPAMDEAGTLYLTTTSSCGSRMRPEGSCDLPQSYSGEVFELTPSGGGWQCTVLHTFTGYDGADPINLSLDGNGNLYGTTPYGGDYGSGSISRLSPS